MTQHRTQTGLVVRPGETAHLLDLALHMANRADDIALSSFDSGVRYELKADGSPVTRVDREVEAALRDTIEREHPQAGVIGEEYGEEAGLGRWIIDPIDGTGLYIDGDPRFATLLAYALEGQCLVGVVSAPALGLRWWAGRGLGARFAYRGFVRTAKTSKTRRLSRSQGMLLGGLHSSGPDGTRRMDEVLSAPAVSLRTRGVSWEAVRVASAEYDFAVTSGHLWDVAPLGVIVEEAGGRATVDTDDDELFRVRVSNRYLAGDIATMI